MPPTPQKILSSTLNLQADAIAEIAGLGTVNSVYDISCKGAHYIVRINPEQTKAFEFWKEKWCIETARSLGVPGPTILQVGVMDGFPFMIMDKIEGVNGSNCTPEEKINIWGKLGEFAKKFHTVAQMQELSVASDEFHDDWSSKLKYNIAELSPEDSLLKREVFSKGEQAAARKGLEVLKRKTFRQGLVHGDLCPRNTIWQAGKVFLLDWGSAKIDVVPHTEIGMVQMDNDIHPDEFRAFISGLGINDQAYERIAQEIRHINFLNRLDLYRWADGNNIATIDEYVGKLRVAFEEMVVPPTKKRSTINAQAKTPDR